MAKKTVFLTGASGSMGYEAFRELLTRKDEYDCRILLRPSRANRERFTRYEGQEGIEIIWGDLTEYEDVLKGVTGADFVLHPAALISPAADRDPDTARKINVGSIENIIRAIRAQPGGGDGVKLVNVGSVAQTGDRLSTIHRSRIGDPLKPSIYDAYATTKIRAERAVIESGLPYWVSLRQTYIAIPDALSLMDPIMFHQPIETKIEMVTARDSGRLLVNACGDDVPEEFWRRVYNVGGGESCRFVFLDYIEHMMKLLGMGDYRKIMDRNWFCLRNFHCAWFEDSDVLEDYLHFRSESLEDHYAQVLAAAPWYVKLAGLPVVRDLIPKALVKHLFIKPMATRKDGPLYWIRNDVEGRISAFFGTRERWERIPDWDVDMPDTTIPARLLDHGYDEGKPVEDLDVGDMRAAARFRGGECLSESMSAGDLDTKLAWRCAFDHEFEASPLLVLKTGHWCPDCEPAPWNYDEMARRNPFFAQVWYPNHDVDERNVYDARCFEDIL